MGALMKCNFGAAPAALIVLPTNRVNTEGPPAATIMDHIPLVNISPFGVCSSTGNPTVAAATAAALGVLTPMPCVPVTPTPWMPGAVTVRIGKISALDDISKCMCTWGGVIEFSTSNTVKTQIP
jgi:hypothetical protein